MLNWLVFRVGIEIDSTSVLGSKSTCFCVGVEIDRVLVWGPTLTCFCAGVKIDLFLVWVENYLLVSERKIDLACDGGRNWFDFGVGDRTRTDFSVGMKLIWLLCGWYKWTSCLYAGRNHCFFRVKTDFVFVRVVQMDLISVRGVEHDLISG